MDLLDCLESDSIYIIRETLAQCRKPALLSGGKDSLVLLHLAAKAFRPDGFSFPIIHIDTGHNFPEVIAFRDDTVEKLRLELIVRGVDEALRKGQVQEESGAFPSRNNLQTKVLLKAIAEYGFDGVMGGARRDEEKSRAKERIFSLRDQRGRWNPKDQRPELWRLYNGNVRPGEHLRIFPLSNWTELDIWHYLNREKLKLPPLYFAHKRDCFRKDGLLRPAGPFTGPTNPSDIQNLRIRFRTVGDMTCSTAVESSATSISEVIAEISKSKESERAGRSDDRRSPWSMEERKLEGYF